MIRTASCSACRRRNDAGGCWGPPTGSLHGETSNGAPPHKGLAGAPKPGRIMDSRRGFEVPGPLPRRWRGWHPVQRNTTPALARGHDVLVPRMPCVHKGSKIHGRLQGLRPTAGKVLWSHAGIATAVSVLFVCIRQGRSLSASAPTALARLPFFQGGCNVGSDPPAPLGQLHSAQQGRHIGPCSIHSNYVTLVATA